MQVIASQPGKMCSTSGYKLFLLLNLALHFTTSTASAVHRSLSIRIPQVRPTHDESYLCSSHRLDTTEAQYIVGFTPNASATRVHHILIYGCSKPGKFMRDTPNYVWECGEMNLGSGDDDSATPFDAGPGCATDSKTTILFGWALDAPAIEMPPNVGFKVGGDSGINYLVLQVHYGNTRIFREDPEMLDDSGIILHTVSGQNHGITKQAGIYLLLSYGYVPVGSSKHTMECLMLEDKVIHPFRFRTHTHKLGVKVGAYKKPGDNPSELVLIGEHDPQQPQMFYPLDEDTLTIGKGDRVYAYCDYNNTRDKTVFIGPTNNDEMCNFYMMYWTEGQLLKKQDCFQYNPH